MAVDLNGRGGVERGSLGMRNERTEVPLISALKYTKYLGTLYTNEIRSRVYWMLGA